MVADPSYYLKLQEQGLLLPYKSKEDANVISEKTMTATGTAFVSPT